MESFCPLREGRSEEGGAISGGDAADLLVGGDCGFFSVVEVLQTDRDVEFHQDVQGEEVGNKLLAILPTNNKNSSSVGLRSWNHGRGFSNLSPQLFSLQDPECRLDKDRPNMKEASIPFRVCLFWHQQSSEYATSKERHGECRYLGRGGGGASKHPPLCPCIDIHQLVPPPPHL